MLQYWCSAKFVTAQLLQCCLRGCASLPIITPFRLTWNHFQWDHVVPRTEQKIIFINISVHEIMSSGHKMYYARSGPIIWMNWNISICDWHTLVIKTHIVPRPDTYWIQEGSRALLHKTWEAGDVSNWFIPCKSGKGGKKCVETFNTEVWGTIPLAWFLFADFFNPIFS